MTLALIAFLAGAFSVLTPCILPVLPALLVVSDGQGRVRVLGVVVGVVASFCIAILALTALVDALGIPADALRYLAAAMLLLFGLVLLVPALDRRFQAAAQGVVRLAPHQHQGNGFIPGVLAGATLGIVWAPCAGPILAGITSSVATEGLGREAVVATLAYGLGMVIPLTAVAFGGRSLVGRLRRATGNGRRVNMAMGMVLLATSALFFSGLDTRLNRSIAQALPFTSTPIAGIERAGFDQGSSGATTCAQAEELVARPGHVAGEGYPETTELCDLGPRPALDALGPWTNTLGNEPITEADLEGKVVLVDFWTYSCINCIRTLPYLRGWHEQYADDGLVILGVHTPEFAFERDLGNVREAIDDLDVTWPVALDNDYETWNRFANRYWPAKYLIDRDGMLRSVHYGEGRYEETEDMIRELLDVEPAEGRADAEGAVTDIRSATPELYVGHERAANFAGQPDVRGATTGTLAADRVATYRQAVEELQLNEWAFVGGWRVEGERAIASGPDSRIRLRYAANEAYLVLAPGAGGPKQVQVTVDGERRPPVTVDGTRLYTVARDDSFDQRLLELRLPEGVEAYAFTFG